MKKIITFLGVAAISGVMAFAQGPQGPQGRPQGQWQGGQGGRPQMSEEQMQQMRERMDPVAQATRKVDDLKQQLGLNDDQYKKVLNIFTSDAKARLNQMQSGFGRMGGGMMGGGGDMPDFSGGGMPQMGEGGMPQMGAMMGGMRGGFGGMMQEDPARVNSRNKKLKKILTADQMTKYLQIQEQEAAEQAERAEQMQKQMQERMQQMQQNGGQFQGGPRGQRGPQGN